MELSRMLIAATLFLPLVIYSARSIPSPSQGQDHAHFLSSSPGQHALSSPSLVVPTKEDNASTAVAPKSHSSNSSTADAPTSHSSNSSTAVAPKNHSSDSSTGDAPTSHSSNSSTAVAPTNHSSNRQQTQLSHVGAHFFGAGFANTAANSTPEAQEPHDGDGYADTPPGTRRNAPPAHDPVGDNDGWGPDAAHRQTSPSGEMPEHFSLLELLFGPRVCHDKPFNCGPDGNKEIFIVFPFAFFMMAYCFKALKVMSDAYWVPSVMNLGKSLNLSPDVAGATLLSFGSSAPEFATNVVATFFFVNECGIGDIMGSAIHNVLLIVGVSGLFAGRSLNIWWFPLSRDTGFYALSIVELVIFLWDEYIQMWESLVMVATYFAYVGFMLYNERILESVEKAFPSLACRPEEVEEEDDDEDGSCWPHDPVEMLWKKTMPDMKTYKYCAFLMPLAWISLISFLMVDSATRFGSIVGMPPVFMGLVFLAAGTSIPDAFASMAAAKRGEGDMAVSNALGSNVFDILMGLALPWLIATAMGQPIVFLGVQRLLYWAFILLVLLAVFVGSVKCNGWRLNKTMGGFLLTLYGFYVIWALLKSYNLVP